MSKCGEVTGSELIELVNRTNTNQSKLESLQALKDYILEQEIDADVLMISLLQEIALEVRHLSNVVEELRESNKYLKKIYNPE
jgi:hypothetical protein